jgi:hypothetical protein
MMVIARRHRYGPVPTARQDRGILFLLPAVVATMSGPLRCALRQVVSGSTQRLLHQTRLAHAPLVVGPTNTTQHISQIQKAKAKQHPPLSTSPVLGPRQEAVTERCVVFVFASCRTKTGRKSQCFEFLLAVGCILCGAVGKVVRCTFWCRSVRLWVVGVHPPRSYRGLNRIS